MDVIAGLFLTIGLFLFYQAFWLVVAIIIFWLLIVLPIKIILGVLGIR
jgi:hypothetical protein